MNTLQLLKFAREDPFISKNFYGVFSSDQLPDILPLNKSLIANICPSNIRGEISKEICHWLVILRFSKRKLLYWDSTALSSYLASSHLTSFLKRHKVKKFVTFFNNIAIQSKQSSNCGLFALVFLALFYRGFSLKHIHSLFHTKKNKLYLNDARVEELFDSIFIHHTFEFEGNLTLVKP